MKRFHKKIVPISLVITMVAAMVLTSFAPLTKVFATGTYDVVITFDVSDQSDVTLEVRDHGIDGIKMFGIRGDVENFIDFEDTYNNTILLDDSVSVVCSTDKHCVATVTLPEEHGVRLVTAGGTPFGFKIGEADYGFNNDNITVDTNIIVVNKDIVQYEGEAFLIWSCRNGGTCYHYFDNLPEGETTFISSATVTDENTGEVFDVNAEVKGMATAKDFRDWQTAYKNYKGIENIDWATLDTSLVVGVTDMRQYEEEAVAAGLCSREGVDEETFHACVDQYVESAGIFAKHANLQPVGEPYSANAYVSYGDRQFKAIIYNNNYRGITLGSLEDLTYYPATWTNPFLRVESYDISGTTAENPMDIETLLLEPIINIETLSEYNDFEIDTIVPLNVPSGAVNVTKNGNQFKFTFGSNFYDDVVFEVTSTNNETYYIRIVRNTISPRTMYDNDHEVLLANLYFDNKDTYTNYVVTARIEYTNGRYKTVTMTNANRIDDGLGNITYAPEVDEEDGEEFSRGKGVKVAAYKYDLEPGEEERISKVYFNVEYAGSTSENYAGAFAGSGKGVTLTLRGGE